jgi:nucleotide-binding universal stress UspA family protein
MSYESLALTILLAWLLTGFVLGIVMERRGYSGFGWGVIGVVLGPMAVLLALFFHLPPRPDETIRLGIEGPGPVDVLVGVDGSAVSIAAAVAVADLLGPRVGTFTLASVEPIDATPDEERSGHAALEAARAAIAKTLQPTGARPGAIVLHGQPAEALRRHAIDKAYDIIAIGSHGRGASRALLGSAAASLLRSSPVPVFVAGHVAATIDDALVASVPA